MSEAIAKVDVLRPNAIPDEMKKSWLAQLDASVRQAVINQHAAQGTVALGTGADFDTSDAAVLLVPMPHEEMYLYWLCAQIDFTLGEITRYSNSMSLYNAAYLAFSAAYKAAHRPLARGQFQL